MVRYELWALIFTRRPISMPYGGPARRGRRWRPADTTARRDRARLWQRGRRGPASPPPRGRSGRHPGLSADHCRPPRRRRSAPPVECLPYLLANRVDASLAKRRWASALLQMQAPGAGAGRSRVHRATRTPDGTPARPNAVAGARSLALRCRRRRALRGHFGGSPRPPRAWIKDIILARRSGEMPDRLPSRSPSTVAAVSEVGEVGHRHVGGRGAGAARPTGAAGVRAGVATAQ